MFAGLVAGVAALAVSSCAYDPYYSGSSYSSGGGYGSGYGYGNSSFSTSFFVSTGNPRWGYDPYAGSYYDYNRRCYYDPHLSGYYPTGYRPRYVHGSPHPHGWRRGRSSIAPPSRIRSHNLTNYQDRTSRYRGLGRDWSRNVRSAPSGRNQRPVQSWNQRPSSNQGGTFGGRRGSGNYTPSQRSGSRGGFRGNTSVTAPKNPTSRGRGSFGRGGATQNSAARQQLMDRMKAARQQGGSRGSRKVTPQVQPQPRPQPRTAPRTAPRASPRASPRAAPQGGGSGRGDTAPSGEGRGRGRGVRGLGEG